MLTTDQRFDTILDDPVHADGPGTTVLTTAELAECTCPEFCERDHDLD